MGVCQQRRSVELASHKFQSSRHLQLYVVWLLGLPPLTIFAYWWGLYKHSKPPESIVRFF